ncbi:MAG: AAA family ATPase, partial [Succinivibrio sp.]
MPKVSLDRIFKSDRLCVKSLEVPGSQDRSRIPALDRSYVFPLPFLNQILLYLACPLHDCLYVSGPSGCGKTTMALQVAARLGWGVEQLTLCGKSESADLIGHAALRRGELVYEYGPLVRAMRQGEILILNEIDLMPPSDLAALNDVLEGKPLVITQNCGELIVPSPGFRVIATANTRGLGDPMGFYSGARVMNQAFLDRFRFVEVGYPDERTESAIVATACPELDGDLASKLVRLAGELRHAGSGQNGAALSAPFSTRVLLRIASLKHACPHLPVHRAVEAGYSLRLPDTEREYVARLCADIFGNDGQDGIGAMGKSAPRRARDGEDAADESREAAQEGAEKDDEAQ